MNHTTRCTDIQELVSAYLDEELDASGREAVRQHVAACPRCAALLDGWLQLRNRVRQEIPAPLGPGFAARVRAAAAPQHGSGHHAARATWRIAAAVLLLASLAGAYLLGREDGMRSLLESGTRAPDQPPLSTIPASAQGSRWRAAREVVTDLRLIDRVPRPLQRPLLQAELEHFGLDEWAGRLLAEVHEDGTGRSLASLIRRLHGVLERPEMHAHISKLRNEARRLDLAHIDFFEHPHRQAEDDGRHARRVKVVMRVGKDLPTIMRTAIDRYLSIKEALVAGRHLDAVSVYQSAERPLELIGPAVEISIASALEQAGLPELSLPFLQPLQRRHPDMFERIRPLLEMHLKREGLLDLDDLDVHIRKALRTIDGTLRIGHEGGESGMSIRLVLPEHPGTAPASRPHRRRPQDI